MESRTLLLGVAGLCCWAGEGWCAPPSDPCALLTAAQVGAVLGVTVDAGKPVGSTMCQWTGTNQPNSIEGKKAAVVIGDAQWFAYAKIPVNGASITKTPVSGVGDEAVYGTTAGRAGSLSVKKGDFYFTVNVTGLTFDQIEGAETALAKDVLGKL